MKLKKTVRTARLVLDVLRRKTPQPRAEFSHYDDQVENDAGWIIYIEGIKNEGVAPGIRNRVILRTAVAEETGGRGDAPYRSYTNRTGSRDGGLEYLWALGSDRPCMRIRWED